MNAPSVSTKSGNDCSIDCKVILSATRSLALRMTVRAPLARVLVLVVAAAPASFSCIVLTGKQRGGRCKSGYIDNTNDVQFMDVDSPCSTRPKALSFAPVALVCLSVCV